jgi:D-amino peptidase
VRKLFISADIEGVCGIADWKETEIGEAQGAYFRSEMTREVRAACEAACEAGVEEIFVKDAHGSGRSIDPSALPENVKIMRSWTRSPCSMMAGIDGSFGGVIFIGYHSEAGSDGNPLAHTMDSSMIVRLQINGENASEFVLNSYIAASFGVPVLMLSGDRKLCEGAQRLCPGIGTVAVSEGIGNASVSINPALAQRLIKEEAAKSLRRSPGAAAIALPPSFDMRIQFRQHHHAYRGSFYPGAERLGPCEVGFKAAKWIDALTFMFFTML